MSNYTWLGHASFRLTGSKTIYIDPYQLEGDQPQADIICITHSHHDHFSPEDIAKIAGPDTVVVATPDCTGLELTTLSIQAGETRELDGVSIAAVPAYTIGKPFHPKEKGWVGYIITLDGTRYYHTGDTDLIPEMETYKADVGFFPVGGKYTMTASEAAQAANMIAPRIAVPMHWGTIIGSEKDAKAFRSACQVPVNIMEPERR